MIKFNKIEMINRIPSVISVRFDYTDGTYQTDVYVFDQSEKLNLLNTFFDKNKTEYDYDDYYRLIGSLIIDINENDGYSNHIEKTNDNINRNMIDL